MRYFIAQQLLFNALSKQIAKQQAIIKKPQIDLALGQMRTIILQDIVLQNEVALLYPLKKIALASQCDSSLVRGRMRNIVSQDVCRKAQQLRFILLEKSHLRHSVTHPLRSGRVVLYLPSLRHSLRLATLKRL